MQHYALFTQTKFQHKHVCRRHCTSEPYSMNKFDTLQNKMYML